MMRIKQADIYTALITPFGQDQKINYSALEKLSNHVIEQGSNGFVIGGTTGENPELTHDETVELYRNFSSIIGGRVPLIAGTGSNNPEETVRLTNEVAEIPGIDAALVVVPPYNKPNQRGMIAHFTYLADHCHLPLLIYNIPGRTGVLMEPQTVISLSHHPGIVGIKQCSSLEDLQTIIEGTDPDFAVFTGEDSQALTARLLGAAGVVSVASHIYASQMRDMYDNLYRGDWQAAGKLQRWLIPRMAALFRYPSPSPVKAVLNAQGYQAGGCSLPILSLTDQEEDNLAHALGLAGRSQLSLAGSDWPQ